MVRSTMKCSSGTPKADIYLITVSSSATPRSKSSFFPLKGSSAAMGSPAARRASRASAAPPGTAKSSVRMARTFSGPIFSSLSMVRITSPACFSRPRMANRPLSTFRLLTRILKRRRPRAVKVL